MLGMEVISLDDQEEDDVEVVYVRNLAPSKVSLLKLEIELLQAFCNSGEQIPLEYDKFYTCAKKVNEKFSDTIILSAWKRAILKQVSNTLRNRNQSSASNAPAPVVDLTEPTSPSRATHPQSPSPSTYHTETSEQDPLESPNEEIVPVALFVNTLFEGVSSDVSTDTVNTDSNVNLNSNDLESFETKECVKHSDKVQETSRQSFPPLLPFNETSTNSIVKENIQQIGVQESNQDLSAQEAKSLNVSDASYLHLLNESFDSNISDSSESSTKRRKQKRKDSTAVNDSNDDSKCSDSSGSSTKRRKQKRKEPEEWTSAAVNDSNDDSKSRDSSGSSTKRRKRKCKELGKEWTSAAVNDSNDDSKSNGSNGSSTKGRTQKRKELGEEWALTVVNDNNNDSKSNGSSGSSAEQSKQNKEETCIMPSLNGSKVRRVSQSFIGVQAKIRKAKCTSNSKSKKTVNCRKSKSMTEDEFKLFREQQKRIKLRESNKLVEKQLEIVHNRLVEVIIPKYHLNTTVEKT